MTFGDVFFRDPPTSEKARVRRETVGITTHQTWAVLPGAGLENRLAWTVYPPGAKEPGAVFGVHKDAVRYAQTQTRRYLAKRWSA